MTREFNQPSVSLIIPTRNRAGTLLRTLRSVARGLGGADGVEVIIVDNGSTDATASVCRTLAQEFPSHPWHYYYDSMPGLLTGRHRGAKEARGEILCYLDDDVIIDPSWIGAIKEAFQDPEVVLVGGPSRALYEIEPPSWVEDLWRRLEGGRMLDLLSLIDYGTEKRFIEAYYVWGLNFSIRKRTLQECGGFHPDCLPKSLQRFQGDGEGGLSFKIEKQGLKSLYHPDAALTHIIPEERLAIKAFEERAFYQGVCDSYTRIRSENSVPLADEQPRPGDAGITVEFMAAAYTAGVDFHQREVRNDHALLEWVLKPDYFDYALPRGWESFLQA
jgi:glucosyl-dolichyl phosphate glucuronosyltransferase